MTLRTPLASRQQRSCARTPIAMAVGAALLALSNAHAQTAPAAASTDQIANRDQKVIVTGYRYSIQKSLDQKREANSIVDVVTAEDIGKFPDKNVADALQRVPGVVVNRDGGEGKNVSVRALSSELTLTELNGNYIAPSPTATRPVRSITR